ncbi:MAG: hypothetical protein DRO52_02290 [Candidatus Hecatellales archaeon]|nr:MAG: hypothetical protein DRO52_02290 [Candidatus Hecatellales archaeon]
MIIMMLTEGTYPYVKGGVSTWTHNLISSLDEFKFVVVAVVANPYVDLLYEPPRNVVRLIMVPLWGTELLEEYVDTSLLRLVKPKPSRKTIREEFLPAFSTFLSEVKSGGKNVEKLGESLSEMHHFFKRYNYKTVFKSEEVWEAFSRQLVEDPLYASLKTSSLIRFGRLIQHLFRVLAYDFPEVDLCHSSVASFCGIPAIVLKMERGVPYLLTEHGVYFRERILDLVKESGTLAERFFWLNLYRAVVRLNYHYADKILPVCGFNVRWEVEFGIAKEKIEIIYNGVDVERFRPRPELEEEKPLIVVMGRVNKLKDMVNVIEAMEYVVGEIPDARCEIIGPIEDKAYHEVCLKRLGELGLEGKVVFKGPSESPEFDYNRARVVAQPSISEGFPFTVVEAMACGKPVVATDVGGVREALEGCGIIVPARDPKRLGEALIQVLIDEKLRRELGEKARRRVVELFSYQRFLTEYRRVYLEAVSKRKLEA